MDRVIGDFIARYRNDREAHGLDVPDVRVIIAAYELGKEIGGGIADGEIEPIECEDPPKSNGD